MGWASPLPLLLLLQLQACIGPAVDSQLLRHHNKQRPHKAEQSRAGLGRAVWDTGRQRRASQTPLKKKNLAINFYTVATETELSLLSV